MGCVTKASQFELARYANEKSVLLLNPYYKKGAANTWTWQIENDWYCKRKKTLLKPWTWFVNVHQDFLLKSLESRYNFVKATMTHGTDIMIVDQEFLRAAEALPFSHSNLNIKYRIFDYDCEYEDYFRKRESGNGTTHREPNLKDFLR